MFRLRVSRWFGQGNIAGGRCKKQSPVRHLLLVKTLRRAKLGLRVAERSGTNTHEDHALCHQCFPILWYTPVAAVALFHEKSSPFS